MYHAVHPRKGTIQANESQPLYIWTEYASGKDHIYLDQDNLGVEAQVDGASYETLAQALERADTERTLVSQIEWDEATRQALAAARERGAQRVGVAEVVLERSAAVVARAAVRHVGSASVHG